MQYLAADPLNYSKEFQQDPQAIQGTGNFVKSPAVKRSTSPLHFYLLIPGIQSHLAGRGSLSKHFSFFLHLHLAPPFTSFKIPCSACPPLILFNLNPQNTICFINISLTQFFFRNLSPQKSSSIGQSSFSFFPDGLFLFLSFIF